jgi:hypothetical protein
MKAGFLSALIRVHLRLKLIISPPIMSLRSQLGRKWPISPRVITLSLLFSESQRRPTRRIYFRERFADSWGVGELAPLLDKEGQGWFM